MGVHAADQHALAPPHNADLGGRSFGFAVARAYAGHTHRASDGGTTTTTIRANLTEIATALAALTGEEHPLAAKTVVEGISAIARDAAARSASRSFVLDLEEPAVQHISFSGRRVGRRGGGPACRRA